MTTTTPSDRTTPPVASLEWLALGGVACIGIAVVMDPNGIEDGPILCPLRLATGLPCPGCGLTRAWVYGMHGRFGESFAANAFGLPLLALVVVVAAVVVVRRVRRATPPSLDALVAHPITKIAFAVWIAWAFVRIGLLLF